MVSLVHPESYVLVPASDSNPRDLFASIEKTNHGLNWYEAHRAINNEGAFMPTPRHFIDFLSHLRSGSVYDGAGKRIDEIRALLILEDITAKRYPYRTEWLDANFRVIDDKLMMNYNHRTVGGILRPQNTEPLESYLMKPCCAELFSADKQGLPTKILEGDTSFSVFFWPPVNNSIARFASSSDGVWLDCGRNPQFSNRGFGVRKFFER